MDGKPGNQQHRDQAESRNAEQEELAAAEGAPRAIGRAPRGGFRTLDETLRPDAEFAGECLALLQQNIGLVASGEDAGDS